MSDELRALLRHCGHSRINLRWLSDSAPVFYQDVGLRRWLVSRSAVAPLQEVSRTLGGKAHSRIVKIKDAELEKLAGDILHYSVRCGSSPSHYWDERYAPLAARQMFEAGRRTSALKLPQQPIGVLAQLHSQSGFRDGLAGLSIASFAAIMRSSSIYALGNAENHKQ